MHPLTRRKLVAAFSTLVLVASFISVRAGEPKSWAGEFKNPKLLGGKAVLQLSIEQQGSTIQVSFDAVQNDGQGVAPEGQGPAKIVGNTLKFSFTDNLKNSGSGTITRSGDDVVVTMKATRVVEPKAIMFYGENMPLKRVGKK